MQLSVRPWDELHRTTGRPRATCARRNCSFRSNRRRARVDSDPSHRQHDLEQPYTSRKQLIDQWCAASGSPTKVGLSEVAFCDCLVLDSLEGATGDAATRDVATRVLGRGRAHAPVTAARWRCAGRPSRVSAG
jgi:hypothetical protein